MTRFATQRDSAGLRAAAGDTYQRIAPKAKERVRQAADAVAPYAEGARHSAARAADDARHRLAPTVSALGQSTPVQRTRESVRTAADYTLPRVEQAVETARTAAEPVREEAVARGAAAVAALRGQVTPADVEHVVRRRTRRARARRTAGRLLLVGALAAGGYAAWTWWNRQTNPDWLVEAPEPTELSDRGRGSLESVDGSEPLVDPEVEAKQAEAEEAERSGKPKGESSN
ncbi:DUF5324 family protein [Streptomyces capparidis]